MDATDDSSCSTNSGCMNLSGRTQNSKKIGRQAVPDPVLRSVAPGRAMFAQAALCQFLGAANKIGPCNLLLFADNPTIVRSAHRGKKHDDRND
ncbi:hypothetical protein [Janthinobacterium sp. PC23-8]|uniref:hypothetical protein n=1 Tax=Janthinobacterium sp. PC23-8 TaxID=2012679 RepID=UPI0011407974|nr:hypothetical protein [Janthinobacterium sp. PC23-8]